MGRWCPRALSVSQTGSLVWRGRELPPGLLLNESPCLGISGEHPSRVPALLWGCSVLCTHLSVQALLLLFLIFCNCLYYYTSLDPNIRFNLFPWVSISKTVAHCWTFITKDFQFRLGAHITNNLKQHSGKVPDLSHQSSSCWPFNLYRTQTPTYFTASFLPLLSWCLHLFYLRNSKVPSLLRRVN